MPVSSKSPFRILMVLDQSFPPDPRVENEALSLIQTGFEVGLLAIAPDDRPTRETYKGITLFRDRLSKQLRNKMRGLVGTIPIYSMYLHRKIGQVFNEFPFDALHIHDLYLFGGGLKAGRALNVPVVGDLHENWVEALKHYAWSTRFPGKLFINIERWERLEKQWVNAVDRLIVVIEEAQVRNLSLGVDQGKIVVVPNTIRRTEFESYQVEQDVVASIRSPFTITYTGGFDVHRGLNSVLLAMPLVLSEVPEARLVLVGDGRIRQELEAQVQHLGIVDHVQFEGWQPQSRLKSYILGSDVCLVPHLKTPHTDATIPHKLFHYMYYEKPVVVSNCRPLERIVKETRAGLVYPSNNASGLAKALLQLVANRDAAQEMGQRGRAAVQSTYHWEETVKGLLAMYEELAQERGWS